MVRVSSPDPVNSQAEVIIARDVVRIVADLVSLVEPRLLALWRATGMTLSQRRVLRQLRDGPRSAGAVAASLEISAPSLTRHLAKLEERSLIVRTLDTADRRRVFVELTADGRRTLTDYRVFAGSPVALACRDLNPRQQRSLVENLRVLVRLARELDAGAIVN